MYRIGWFIFSTSLISLLNMHIYSLSFHRLCCVHLCYFAFFSLSLFFTIPFLFVGSTWSSSFFFDLTKTPKPKDIHFTSNESPHLRSLNLRNYTKKETNHITLQKFQVIWLVNHFLWRFTKWHRIGYLICFVDCMFVWFEAHWKEKTNQTQMRNRFRCNWVSSSLNETHTNAKKKSFAARPCSHCLFLSLRELVLRK